LSKFRTGGLFIRGGGQAWGKATRMLGGKVKGKILPLGPVGPTALLWVFSLSIAAIGLLPKLPELEKLLGAYLVTALVVALAFPRRNPWMLLLLVSLAGSSWAVWSNQAALDQRLPLWANGSDHVLEVEVVSLPETRSADTEHWPRGPGNSVRFQAKVLSTGGYVAPGSLLYLTWYRAEPDILARLRGNSRWLLPVRLKRPRGSVNPHGFDYEGWLLRRGVYATGYLRPREAQPEWLGQGWGLARVRDGLRDSLRGQPYERSAVIAALLLGDRSGLSEGERETLQRTGTAHLLAISGLHVGMVAGFLLLIGAGIARCIGICTGTSPRGLPVLLALVGVLAYTLLAGAPLSAQRAMVMTWVLLLALQWRRRICL